MSNPNDTLRIEIPSRKSWIAIILQGACLVVWGLVEWAAVSLLLSTETPPGKFLMAWAVAWTLGGVLALLSFLWITTGADVITTDGDWLRMRRQILGVGFTHRFPSKEVHHLRVVPPKEQQRSLTGGTSGTIAFECESKTYGFGDHLEEREAQVLIGELARKL